MVGREAAPASQLVGEEVERHDVHERLRGGIARHRHV